MIQGLRGPSLHYFGARLKQILLAKPHDLGVVGAGGQFTAQRAVSGREPYIMLTWSHKGYKCTFYMGCNLYILLNLMYSIYTDR